MGRIVGSLRVVLTPVRSPQVHTRLPVLRLADFLNETDRSEVAMYAVVNHMKLSRPLDNDITERMSSELMSNLSKMPAFANALCVQVADDGIVIIVICESEEALERCHQEVGSPWVGQNLGAYLAGTDRKVGPVIARPL